RVEIGHLLLRDLGHLLLGHLSDLVLVWCTGSLGNTGSALQQDRSRRRLGDESERPVVINRHHHRDDQAVELFGVRARVELLAELHDVDLRLAQRWTDRRRRRRLSRRNLQLYASCNFFRHLSIHFPLTFQTWAYATFSTCPNSSSTGVARPKIVTITLSVSRSSFTSSIDPVNVANGPSVMRTDSPFSNFTLSLGLSRPVSTR